ncbi:hypothetical protein [Rhodococcus qingshengii]|uniref:hypothetical protein n=1 Tax=Rhodococcus qingshengii TaxID=334542 RepID=UPI0035DC7FC3
MTGSPYDWLPDRHLGVATTLAHSDELIGQVSALLFQFQTQQGDVIGLRSEKHGPVVRTVVDRISPMPPKIPRLVADALVALRAAIEHAIFAEVEYLDGPLGEKAAKLVEMPAAETYDAFQEWKKKRRKNGPHSLQDGSELVRRISALQPFHRLQNPQQHPLALLVSHTNHAKHRTPASTAVLIAAMYGDAKVPRTIDALLPGPKGPVSVGDVIGEAPLGVVVPITMFPTVGINRPGTDEWPVMLNELREIAEWVRLQAVPRLITGGSPPVTPLPARYDISVAHDDERLAIAAGSATSAAAGHALRLASAVGRLDLAELISSIDGALDPLVLSEWLGGLPDEEIHKRAECLATTRGGRPTTNQQKLDALRQLRGEAVEYTEQRRQPTPQSQ